MDKLVLSVFELNTYVSDKLYQDPFLDEIWVRGEIGDLSVKHDIAYFVLSDGDASVDCMAFDFSGSPYAELLQDGQAVLLNGEVSIYRKNGRFRVAVRQIELTGLGEMYARFNRLKEKLEGEGLFAAARKRAIPGYPKKIGIVTSSGGAAIHDIIEITRRRNPLVRLVLYPVKVQGAEAPGEIVRGIQWLNDNTDADVLIVGRGGGAAEDLFAFNDEGVVRRIVASRIPVISAVGHESDWTLADMAADLRAPTPSAAAELATPVRDDVIEQVKRFRAALETAMRGRLQAARGLLEHRRTMLSDQGVSRRAEQAARRIDAYRAQAALNMNLLYQSVVLRYNTIAAGLEAMDPQQTMQRGYAVVLKGGKAVKSAKALKMGDKVEIRFGDGSVRASVDGEK